MEKNNLDDNELEKIIHKIQHYLPAQAPLKDFIHHNTLHAFQDRNFFEGLSEASVIFGYKVSLSLHEYRSFFDSKKIREDVLERVIINHKGKENLEEWKNKLLVKTFHPTYNTRIGSLRAHWKQEYKVEIDGLVHSKLFRVLCSFLDQGISIWKFPLSDKKFLDAIREMELNSFSSFFKTTRAKKILIENKTTLEQLLNLVVGDNKYFEHYLFDQQFAHQGWSGMVASIEQSPETLIDKKKITLKDLVFFELLLEIDSLDYLLGENWEPLSKKVKDFPVDIFAKVEFTEFNEALYLWQLSLEWSYYDDVLLALKTNSTKEKIIENKSFQALFCIDDRECSFRRYLEDEDANCETFGTPGFFGVDSFFQPQGGKFYTKICPAPVKPKHLIKEVGVRTKQKKEIHFSKYSQSFHSGWLISQTLGFWSTLKLAANIFMPSTGPASAASLKHMNKNSKLLVLNKDKSKKENDLQIGYTSDEMTDRVEALLKSIGLVKDFASIIYVCGHGASSVNNPHYAAYDCGACSGRAGSVNARTFSFMANNATVQKNLIERGIVIPESTVFIGGLRDTTRDEIVFYDIDLLGENHIKQHLFNLEKFEIALDKNAKERSRRFELENTHLPAKKIHQQLLKRSVSLFEPRPELNHATNALCIVGRRELSQGVFLDRRSFLNSYDYKLDPEGKYLLTILNAAAPVCGGINLEYYFSRVDNQKLGAGSKLPHNVMGLIAVANGIDGDLRPGLPSQMIEVHDPLRLLLIVEHFPEVVEKTIKVNPATFEWFDKEWVNLAVIHPQTKQIYSYQKGDFVLYNPIRKQIKVALDINYTIETHKDNIPVLFLK